MKVLIFDTQCNTLQSTITHYILVTMKIVKFLITRNVYILLLISLIATVQLINCEQPPTHGSHKGSNITLTAKNGTIYTYNPKPPKALRLGKGSFGDAVIGKSFHRYCENKHKKKTLKVFSMLRGEN